MHSESVSEYSLGIVNTKSDAKSPRSLKEWREARDLKQRDAARKLGISQGYYSKLELGIQTPRPKLAKRLMQRTGLALEVLMGIAS